MPYIVEGTYDDAIFLEETIRKEKNEELFEWDYFKKFALVRRNHDRFLNWGMIVSETMYTKRV